jgi:two-component system, chemotaxis family, chemotaxis protein CheY
MTSVLVVDDSRATRAILRRMLEADGCRVREAGDGLEALAALEADPSVDVALVDWNMPNLDGLGLVRAVRARADWARIRLLMVTAQADMAQVIEALEEGADEYAMKPFDAAVIRHKLALLGVGHG